MFLEIAGKENVDGFVMPTRSIGTLKSTKSRYFETKYCEDGSSLDICSH